MALACAAMAQAPPAPFSGAFGGKSGGEAIGTVNSLDKGDFRQNNPRYAGHNLARNRDLFASFMDIAKELNVTAAQLSLAWLLHQGEDIIPIPGTRRFERVDENADASAIKLNSATLQRINELARPGLAKGATLV